MSLLQQTRRLRKRLQRYAERPDKALLFGYSFLHKPRKLPAARKARLKARFAYWRQDRRLREPKIQHSWQARLKHAPADSVEAVLLVWAVDVADLDLRAACQGLAEFLAVTPGLLPVLVTDQADFAWYSRLGWLVEYVPNLGDKQRYKKNKLRYLAWRYRDAIVLPARAGLVPRDELTQLLEYSK